MKIKNMRAGNNLYKIYTDGSRLKNGMGGYGICIMNKDNTVLEELYTERYTNITNNQAELQGVLRALQITQEERNKDKIFIIYCDSAYCVNICNDWIYRWAANGWKRDGNKQIKNLDLIKQLYGYLTIEEVNFRIEKISGHADKIGNELADAIATQNKLKFLILLDENNITKHSIDF